MNERTKIGIDVLKAAAVVGVSGDLLLRQVPWGLNTFLFVTLFVAAFLLLMRRHRPEFLTKTNIALAAAMTFFASMFAIRSSEELLVFDTLAIIAIMGVLVLSSVEIRAPIAGAFHYIAGLAWAGLVSVFGSFVLLGSDIDWKSMPGNRLSRNVFSVLRGIAIALPLVLIFGGLFVAADTVFEGWVNRAINFDVDILISHLVVTSGLAWLAAGYFRGVITTPFAAAANAGTETAVSESKDEGDEPCTLPGNASILDYINISDDGTRKKKAEAPETASPSAGSRLRNLQDLDPSRLPSVFTLGTVETVIVLGVLDLLFLVFVIAQIPYLFGGFEFVQNTPGFGMAEYARRGFGELVAVSFLVLPVLLLSHWLLRGDGAKTERIYKVLAGIQIGLLFVIMASAVQRLLLLTGEYGYGLTTTRFYPMVLMVWLAVVFVWFAATVLRGARKHFAWGALWAAIAILGTVNLLDPDAFIARTNIALMHQGREFDAAYNTIFLSTDAVPDLLAAIPSMPPDAQCRAKFELHVKYWMLGTQGGFWRLNLSRRTALSLLRANDPMLHEREGCPQWMQLPPEEK
ncbi:MAG: DUF4173 domain-containing protein [Acidobacteria bacterium]|nr:DUF4173 domain-containing protein [Acidobacteriota bacterium]